MAKHADLFQETDKVLEERYIQKIEKSPMIPANKNLHL